MSVFRSVQYSLRKWLLVTLMVAACVGAYADTPDFIADKLTGNAIGFIDTGYKFKAKTYPRTSRMTIEIYSDSYGKGTAPGPVQKSDEPRFFGWADFRLNFDSKNSRGLVWRWGSGSGHQQYVSGVLGNSTIDVDFVKLTGTWNGTSFSGSDLIPNWDSTGTTCCLFTQSGGYVPAVVDFKNFKIYELADAEATESSLVHDYVPCVKGDRPGIYDKVSGGILYPKDSPTAWSMAVTNDFEVSGYDIAVAAGRRFVVGKHSAAPRTLTLESGSELVFNIDRSMTVSGTITLPASGTAVISFGAKYPSGKGKYVLMNELPADFDLSKLTIGSLPGGHSGVLSVEGNSLILTLTATEMSRAEAVADTIRGNAIGAIDTGYKFINNTYPRTAFIDFDFCTDTYGAGSEPGAVQASTTPQAFGYVNMLVSFSTTFKRGEIKRYPFGSSNTEYVSDVNGDNHLEIDILNRCGRWNSVSFGSNVTPELTGWESDGKNGRFQIFSGPGGYAPAVFDFERLAFYELPEAEGVVRKTHEFLPSISEGKPCVYDTFTGDYRFPEDCPNAWAMAVTNDFLLSALKYRLAVNGEVTFVEPGAVTIAAVDSSVTGWAVLDDSSRSVLYSGSGNSATFTMPARPAELVWTKSGSVVGSKTVSSDQFFADLDLSSCTALNFSGGRIVFSGEMTLPESGTIAVTVSGGLGAGLKDLIVGVKASDLARFSLDDLPTGLTGVLEVRGNVLSLRLFGSSPTVDALPDALGETLTGNAVGIIDTEYKYKAKTYPRTSRMILNFASDSYGKGTSPGPVQVSSTPYVFGWADFLINYDAGSSRGRVLRFPGGSVNQAYITGVLGDSSIDIDFIDETGTWNGSAFGGTDLIPNWDGAAGCHLFSNSGGYVPAVMDFKRFAVYEKADDEAEAILAHDFVPCRKDGKVGIYDLVAKTYRYPKNSKTAPQIAVTNDFVLGTLKYPTDLYAVTAQEFAPIKTVCPLPVSVPEFSAERTFTFRTDGTLVTKVGADTIVVALQDASGTELSRQEYAAVAAGTTISVELGTAARAVVSVAGAVYDGLAVAQRFPAATATSSADIMYRSTGKRRSEYLLVADADFVFDKMIVATVSRFDSADVLLGEERIEGKTIPVLLNGAEYARISVHDVGGMAVIFK